MNEEQLYAREMERRTIEPVPTEVCGRCGKRHAVRGGEMEQCADLRKPRTVSDIFGSTLDGLIFEWSTK